MSTCNAIGALAKLLAQSGSSPATFADTSERYDFVNETLAPKHIWVGPERGAGELGVTAGARRRKLTVYAGRITLPASPANLAAWMPRAMWGTTTPTSFALGTSHSSQNFDLLINRENGIFHYQNCVVKDLSITSDTNKNEFAVLSLGLLALNESQGTPWPSPEPDLPTANDTLAYLHYESSMTLNAVPIPYQYIRLHIDNKIVPIASGSVTPQKFRSLGRDINLKATCAFTSLTQAEAESALQTEADAVLTYTSTVNGHTTTINFQNAQNTGHTHPNVSGNKEIPLPVSLQAGKDNISTPELTVTQTT